MRCATYDLDHRHTWYTRVKRREDRTAFGPGRLDYYAFMFVCVYVCACECAFIFVCVCVVYVHIYKTRPFARYLMRNGVKTTV